MRVEPSNEATLTNYTLLNFLISGISVSLMRGSEIYSGSNEEYIKLLSIFVILGIGGRIIAGLISDIFYKKHLLVLISVMLVCVGLMFPSKYGLTMKVIITSVGYSTFKASAGASILARSENVQARYIGIFISSGAVGMALAMIRPVIGYYMLPFAMFAACASDRYGEEYQNIINSRIKKREVSTKGRLSGLSLLLYITAIICSIITAIGLFYLYFEKCMFWGADTTKFGPVIAAMFFALGNVIGGFATDKIGGTITQISASLLAAFCMISAESLFFMPKIMFLLSVFFMGAIFPAIICFVYTILRKAPGASIGMILSLGYPAYFIACKYHIYRLKISQISAIMIIFAFSICSALIVGIIMKKCKSYSLVLDSSKNKKDV